MAYDDYGPNDPEEQGDSLSDFEEAIDGEIDGDDGEDQDADTDDDGDED